MEVDIVVVGLGVLGSSALWQTSRRGISCLGIEQFSLPHVRGSSHGGTRIIRSLYPQQHFSSLVDRAWGLWKELETEAKTELIVETGAVDFGIRNSKPMNDLVSICETNKIPYQLLDGQQASERFPGLRVPDDFDVIATERAGIIKASKSTAVLQLEAVKAGARICDETKLISVEDKKGSLVLTVRDQRVAGLGQTSKIQCKKVIICPGAWLSPSMKELFNVKVHSDVLQMGYYYFESKGEDKNVYDASKFPVFVDYSSEGQHIYGTPSYEYPSLLKVGAHGTKFTTNRTTADSRSFSVNPELLEFTQQRVQKFFPKANWGKVLHSETCLYTQTKNAEFLIDKLPSNPNVIVGGGGSGHAFKHAAAIGEVLVDLALDVPSEWANTQSFSFDYHMSSNANL